MPLSGPCRRGTRGRVEVDHANTRSSRLQQENAVLSEKLSSSVAGQEMAVKARVVGMRPSSA
jgi:hypothetical protein